MNTQLVKREDRWDLYNEDGHKIASTLDGAKYKLSLKNCEAIANGYDLDELAEEHIGCSEESYTLTDHWRYKSFQAGFQKALEILGDKKFSEQDMIKAIDMSRQGIVVTRISEWETEKEFDYNETQIIQSLQQTEWDVEVDMEDKIAIDGHTKIGIEPKLDTEGCLILKRS